MFGCGTSRSLARGRLFVAVVFLAVPLADIGGAQHRHGYGHMSRPGRRRSLLCPGFYFPGRVLPGLIPSAPGAAGCPGDGATGAGQMTTSTSTSRALRRDASTSSGGTR